MTARLRAILDRINDVEAALARVDSEANEHSSLGYRLTVSSLENRREALNEELADATRESFVEVCDYRIVPDSSAGYSITAVTAVLQDFQEMVTIVYDAITDKPKQKASRDPLLLEKTNFEFGFAYGGSLGIALVVRNDRELFDSAMDQAIAAVFEIIASDTKEKIHDVAAKYGRPAVRKLHSWSKTHSQYGMAADIKWVRDRETKNAVLAQPQELAAICQFIEARNDPVTEIIAVNGVLASWDTVHRRFIVDVPDGDSISGTISEDIDLSQKRTVKVRYRFDLLRNTVVDYSLDQERVTWVLEGLGELN